MSTRDWSSDVCSAELDTFADLTGTLAGSDRDSGQTATLSYALDTGETGVGAYGTLTVDAAGHYTYVANASAINALHDGVSDSDVFTVKVTDADGEIGRASCREGVARAKD